MKTKITGVLLATLLGISITACTGQKNISNVNITLTPNIEEISNSNAPTSNPTSGNLTITKNEENLAMEAYKAVLQNKAEFFSTDNKKNVYLKNFLNNKEIYDTIFKVSRFTVLDMDGDKLPEVVLELTVGDYVQFYEILRYKNGEVYGYIRVLRSLNQLKTDGTFSYSNGASDTGIGKLRFESKTNVTDITLGYTKPSLSNGNIITSYFIDDKPAAEGSYRSFLNEQEKKKGAVWHEFTQKNIETELSES